MRLDIHLPLIRQLLAVSVLQTPQQLEGKSLAGMKMGL